MSDSLRPHESQHTRPRWILKTLCQSERIQTLFKSDSWVFGLFVSFCPEFAPATPVGSYFQSYTVSLYFVAQGEVCPSAALQQRVPGSQVPNLSHSLLRDSTSLFVGDKALKVSSSETSSCWSGATDLAYPRCVEVPCWLFQGPIVTRVTFCWDALNSLSHREPYFKLLKLAWSLDIPLLSPDIKNKLAPWPQEVSKQGHLLFTLIATSPSKGLSGGKKKRSQTLKTTYYTISFVWSVPSRQNHTDRK